MVSTRKKTQSNKKLLSQLDDFDQHMIIGNAASERQENVVVNEGTNDQGFTVGTSNVSSIVDENALNVRTLERCFNERNDREMNNIVETVEDRIQNAILTAIDNIVAPNIELAIRSINTSSGRDVTSVSANSERREHAGINAFFENASENNNKLNTTNENDETRQNNHDEVSELSVPGTHFDRQPHTHHNNTTATRHIQNSMSDVIRLVATEHVHNKYSLREAIYLKSNNLLIASICLQTEFKLHLLQSIKKTMVDRHTYASPTTVTSQVYYVLKIHETCQIYTFSFVTAHLVGFFFYTPNCPNLSSSKKRDCAGAFRLHNGVEIVIRRKRIGIFTHFHQILI